MAWVNVCELADVTEDIPFAVELNGKQLGIYKVGDEVFALENVCPHAYALLTDGFVEDAVIECPLHEAMFEIRTGKLLGGPGQRNLCMYPVKVEDDQVFVEDKEI
ncbi:MAG TPA: non-heme iron oxygenase ferredoxin subunit [Paenalcaligenes sp.]|nr:non-heme iron oxygenase ferredoxin subunit [Paenalcaligenes sp.]